MLTQSQYAELYSSPLTALQQQVLDFTLTHHAQSHMISGAVQGQFLQLLSMALQPRRILEIGTFTGFSALCLVAGLPADGLLYTLELRPDDAETAQQFFDQSPLVNQIKLCLGPASDVIPTLTETWDLVFLDADKTGYSHYYDLVLPQMRHGGILIADNVLFHDMVLQTPITGKNAIAIDAFNKKVQADARVDNVLLSVRDGLLVVRKK
ncbi:MAG: O-methyltransferase [Bacteroidetes bacterium]|nr:MAG: O-methyltransferase [Bacteroidota bacterium]